MEQYPTLPPPATTSELSGAQLNRKKKYLIDTWETKPPNTNCNCILNTSLPQTMKIVHSLFKMQKNNHSQCITSKLNNNIQLFRRT